MPGFALTILLGAFLLFEAQPLIGKYILPWFGGAPGVWTTCMLFFQTLLLGGYAYAHFSSRRLKPRAQVVLHLALFALALLSLPIIPSDPWKPAGGGNPMLQILPLLLACIGLPYFVLSSTGPLMQHWFNRVYTGVSPYRLYALSNAGSLLALLGYPFFFETHFRRSTQAAIWGWGLAVYGIGAVFCAFRYWRAPSQLPETASKIPGPASAPATAQKVLWLLLASCASTLLLATTNKICQEIAVIPFLWVLPLSLYLLSFILCFDNQRWYSRVPFALALVVAWDGICWALFKGTELSIVVQISIYSTGLFVCCMVCHGELYRLKPDPQYLTSFYLMIAAGGALGGLFVAVIAPLIFSDYYELQSGLVLCGVLLLMVCLRDRPAGKIATRQFALSGFLILSLVALASALVMQTLRSSPELAYRTRNFYGVLSVSDCNTDEPAMHHFKLKNGQITHGLQFVDPIQAAWPTLYYDERSGVGLAFAALPAGQRRIGVVGLGVGTLASYAQPGDNIHFYEINAGVKQLATTKFSYLAKCLGKVEVTPGDARLSLEREPPQAFDLLVLDAFNSDAIPLHLLTAEAFAVYERHLKTNGVLAFHISNRNVNLEPVLLSLAQHFDYYTAVIDHGKPKDKPWIEDSVWMLLSSDRDIITSPSVRLAARPARTNAYELALWTDDFASLFQVLNPAKTIRLDPAFEAAQDKLAFGLGRQGNFAGAIGVYRNALKKYPKSPNLLNNLAYLLAACPDAAQRNNDEALKLDEQACQLTHYRNAALVSTLAAIYSEAGRYSDAIEMGQKASALAADAGDEALFRRNQQLLELYVAHRPYHDSLPKK